TSCRAGERGSSPRSRARRRMPLSRGVCFRNRGRYATSRLLSCVPCRLSLADRIHTDFRVVLPMSLRLLVVLAPAQLEDLHLRAAAVADDRRGHFRARDQGIAELDGVAIRDHQHLVEDDLSANVCRYLFYFDFFAGGNAVLLAAGFYDRVHCGLLEIMGSCPVRDSLRAELDIIAEIPRIVKDLSRNFCGRRGSLPRAPRP